MDPCLRGASARVETSLQTRLGRAGQPHPECDRGTSGQLVQAAQENTGKVNSSQALTSVKLFEL